MITKKVTDIPFATTRLKEYIGLEDNSIVRQVRSLSINALAPGQESHRFKCEVGGLFSVTRLSNGSTALFQRGTSEHHIIFNSKDTFSTSPDSTRLNLVLKDGDDFYLKHNGSLNANYKVIIF